MSTPQDLITIARGIINDADATLYRQSSADLLGYLNAGIKQISGFQPGLFYTIGDLACTSGQCEQVLTFTAAQQIVNVLCIHGGAAIPPFDMAVMDRFKPGWRADTPAPATQWARYDGDPLRFFLYPAAPVAQTVDIMYLRIPTVLGLLDTINEIPASLEPALVDFIVYRAESKDDEHTLSQRAAGHYQSFLAQVNKGAAP